MIKLILLSSLAFFVSCGEIKSALDDLDIDEDDHPTEIVDPTPLPTNPPKPEPVSTLAKSRENLKNALKETWKPDSTTGFKCFGSNTRNGEVVCVLPYQYTVPPYYTKVDHHGNNVMCNKDFVRFEQVILNHGTISTPLYFEDKNPYGNELDYGCANYVGTPLGPIGRQHWRGNIKYDNVISKKNVSLTIIEQGKKGTIIVK